MGSQHKSGWRGIRPLLWWLLLVLVLYGIRWNQQELEQTRLYFSITLRGHPLPYPVMVTWDGKPLNSGDEIPLGNHRFAITGPKTDSFSTNLSIWYGKHDLGEISLQRSMGTLSIKASLPITTITISGPEFSTNLQDSSGADLAVPTDFYAVSAQYRRWSDSRAALVKGDAVSPITFSPKFGAVNLSCNRDGATYQLQNQSGQIQENGNLPATLSDLPVGDYQATIFYHNRTMQKSVIIQPDTTNDVPMQFELGALRLETVPNGAEVRSVDGNYFGRTPLLLADMTPQTAQFRLFLSGFEPVSVTLDIAADQTNLYSTNLVGVGYSTAIWNAKMYLAASNYEASAQSAGAALDSKPGDADALAIQSEANEHLKGKRQQQEKLQRPRKWFDQLCSEYPAANLFAEHELESSKPASEVVLEIVSSLTNSPNVFKIMKASSPEADTYEIVAKQTGFLDATERDCLIVVGSLGDGDTQIRFKVLEFEIEHHFTGDNQLIPLSQSKVENNSLLLLHVQEGLKIVMGKTQQALGNAGDGGR